ncbi:MAG TPA: hypothetical protein VLB76_13110 [Thermoanaerobaculia bacterium]|jgi:hypothetical protein|nr:hypothetical protein [Thermoanaerobaculia bacterium]
MDIDNTTGQDTKYKVTGTGGPPIGPHSHGEFRIEEAVSWPVLAAGSKVSYNPKSEGPWTVYFVVQNKGITVTVKSHSDRLTLMQQGAGFHVQIN